MNIQDKVIVVTGAGRGIGEGIVQVLGRNGAKVVVSDIDSSRGQAVADKIGQSGGAALFFRADVSKSKDVAALLAFTVEKYGRLDAIVNNAGWTHRNKPVLEITEEEYEKCFDINVRSIFLSIRHAVPLFQRFGGGSFINIASTAGIRPRPGLSWYNASKGAVITASKSLAAELGPMNIRVNCVNPVFNPDTGLSAEFAGGPLDEARRQKFLTTIPLGRFSSASDVANAVWYLVSDEAAFISGVCLEVDGARCV